MAVFQSRWGFHPCDYATFLKLKKLHARYWQALRQYAQWRRWQRKQPQNRVLRQWIRDAQGRRIGRRIIGPWPEPPLDPLFCVREQVESHFAEDGRLVREGQLVERVLFREHGIPEAYRLARTPVAAPELVRELPVSLEALCRPPEDMAGKPTS